MNGVSELQLNRDFARLSLGDRSAITPVFQGLWPSVYRFCRRYLGSDSDADDAAQRALEKLFDQSTDYDPSRSVVAWSLSIALFECRTLRRHSTRRRAQSIDQDFVSPLLSPEQAVEQGQLHAALDAAIEQLSAVDRETLEQVLCRQPLDPSLDDDRFRKRKQRALVRLKAIWRTLYGT